MKLRQNDQRVNPRTTTPTESVTSKQSLLHCTKNASMTLIERQREAVLVKIVPEGVEGHTGYASFTNAIDPAAVDEEPARAQRFFFQGMP